VSKKQAEGGLGWQEREKQHPEKRRSNCQKKRGLSSHVKRGNSGVANNGFAGERQSRTLKEGADLLGL